MREQRKPMAKVNTIYTLKEAAAMTGLHAGSIRKRLIEGRSDALRVGRDWLFTESQVAQLKREAKPQRKRGTKG
jgi:excisionase family DNA binding protein